MKKPAKTQPSPDPMGRTKEIMRRLAEMPPKPHEPIGKQPTKRRDKSKDKKL